MKRRTISKLIAAVVILGSMQTIHTVKAAEVYFSDNFENGSSNWTVESSTWDTVEDDSKVFSNTVIKKSGIAVRGDKDWTDYTVEAKVKGVEFNGSNKASVCGRYADKKNYYAVEISEKNGVKLTRKVKGSTTTIAQKKMEIKEGTWYDVKLAMEGSNIKVYVDDELIIEKEDKSLAKGAVALMSNKVNVLFDDVVVSGAVDNSNEDTNLPNDEATPQEPVEDEPTMPEVPSVSEQPSTPENPSIPDNSEVSTDLSKYSETGFATGNIGGGVIDENAAGYVKVTNALELAKALKTGSEAKVIEIANDIDLGWNTLPSEAKNSPYNAHNSALTHPLLKESGITKVGVNSFDGLTIFSKNGSKITHAGFTFKGCKNVIVRNVVFDELWEWDENTKGNYDRNDWDYVTVQGCNNVWIDHCTFGKAYDGIVDSKKGTTGLTVSWCKFLPGDINSDFYKAMFNEMESNRSAYPMYNFLRNQGLTQETIMQVSAPQKKTHLIGSSEFASDNADLQVTLHHNYYKDSQDRMPRLRGGNAHVYNVVMDSRGANAASKLIPSDVALNINAAGYHFGLSSNGALSTENGALLLEKSVILGVKSPLKNNQKSVDKPNYTGKIIALDTIYENDGISFRGDSTTEGSPLSPKPADALEFSWNGFNVLPYEYKADEPDTLFETLSADNGTGAGAVNMSSENWMKITY